MVYETIKNVFDKKNSKDTIEDKVTTEGKVTGDINECEEDKYPTYDVVHGYLISKHIAEKSFLKNTIKK